MNKVFKVVIILLTVLLFSTMFIGSAFADSPHAFPDMHDYTPDQDGYNQYMADIYQLAIDEATSPIGFGSFLDFVVDVANGEYKGYFRDTIFNSHDFMEHGNEYFFNQSAKDSDKFVGNDEYRITNNNTLNIYERVNEDKFNPPGNYNYKSAIGDYEIDVDIKTSPCPNNYPDCYYHGYINALYRKKGDPTWSYIARDASWGMYMGKNAELHACPHGYYNTTSYYTGYDFGSLQVSLEGSKIRVELPHSVSGVDFNDVPFHNEDSYWGYIPISGSVPDEIVNTSPENPYTVNNNNNSTTNNYHEYTNLVNNNGDTITNKYYYGYDSEGRPLITDGSDYYYFNDDHSITIGDTTYNTFPDPNSLSADDFYDYMCGLRADLAYWLEQLGQDPEDPYPDDPSDPGLDTNLLQRILNELSAFINSFNNYVSNVKSNFQSIIGRLDRIIALLSAKDVDDWKDDLLSLLASQISNITDKVGYTLIVDTINNYGNILFKATPTQDLVIEYQGNSYTLLSTDFLVQNSGQIRIVKSFISVCLIFGVFLSFRRRFV